MTSRAKPLGCGANGCGRVGGSAIAASSLCDQGAATLDRQHVVEALRQGTFRRGVGIEVLEQVALQREDVGAVGMRVTVEATLDESHQPFDAPSPGPLLLRHRRPRTRQPSPSCWMDHRLDDAQVPAHGGDLRVIRGFGVVVVVELVARPSRVVPSPALTASCA